MEYGTKIYNELPTVDREATLKANCLRTEEMEVEKHFTEKEILEMRKEFTDNYRTIHDAQRVLDEAREKFNSITAPLKKTNEYLLKNIHTGYTLVNQQVYLFDDQHNSTMFYYDANGELVKSRRLKPEERQIRIN